MGCLSSKMVSKSSNFRGNQGPKNKCNGLSVLDNMLMSSNAKRNHLLALLYMADTMVLKLKAEEQENGKKFDDLPNKVTGHVGHDTVNTWELMVGLKEEEHKEQQHDEQMKGQEPQEDNCSLQIEVIHVDDFLSSSSDDDDDDYSNDVRDDEHGELVVKDCGNKGEESDSWEESRSQVAPPPQGQEDSTVKSEATEESICTDLESVTVRDIVGSDSMRLLSNGGGEVGWQEEVARDYELDEEFRISSFRFLGMADHLHGSGEEKEEEGSLSGYITPRFGSYVKSTIKRQMKEMVNGEGGGILHDELIAQLEEAMKQMTDEEEHVLMKIVEDFMEQVL